MVYLVDLLVLLKYFFDGFWIINNRSKGQVFSTSFYFIVFLSLLLAVFEPSLWLFGIQVQIAIAMSHPS